MARYGDGTAEKGKRWNLKEAAGKPSDYPSLNSVKDFADKHAINYMQENKIIRFQLHDKIAKQQNMWDNHICSCKLYLLWESADWWRDDKESTHHFDPISLYLPVRFFPAAACAVPGAGRWGLRLFHPAGNNRASFSETTFCCLRCCEDRVWWTWTYCHRPW